MTTPMNNQHITVGTVDLARAAVGLAKSILGAKQSRMVRMVHIRSLMEIAAAMERHEEEMAEFPHGRPPARPPRCPGAGVNPIPQPSDWNA